MQVSDMAISGLGMVSCVGYDVDTACASIRAGLTRPSQHVGLEPILRDLEDDIPVTLNNIDGITNGFYMTGLWARMTLLALQNLIEREALNSSDEFFWQTTGLSIAVPILDPQRFMVDEVVEPEVIRQILCEALLPELPSGILQNNISVCAQGHSGVAAVLVDAMDSIRSKKLNRVIVVGVDSYTDAATLKWVAENDRVKTESRPAGMSLGEAAACIVVELEQAVLDRGADVYSSIRALSCNNDAEDKDQSTFSNALSKVILDCVEQDEGYSASIVSDINGEQWRARALSTALVSLTNKISDYEVLVPCQSLGDTGSASAVIGICIASRAFARNYAAHKSFLVTSLSENGSVGCIRIDQFN
ncbi:MAG: hypothetical protein OEZ58_05475 [Gammaproteobacteria bacterium]|nr:hypothetical protein [Gammaproteobacteria bacterium]